MKLKSWMILPLAIAALLLILIGCGDDDMENSSSNQITMEDREDVADDFSAALTDSNEGMMYQWNDEPGASPQSVGRELARQSLDDTLIVQHNGFSLVRVRNFYDGFGNWSDIFELGLTVRMQQFLSIEGERESPSGNRHVSLSHHDTLLVNGLLPLDSVRHLDGSGMRSVEGSFQSRFRQNVRTFSADYAWTVNNVQLSSDLQSNPYPLDGSMAVDAEWTRTHSNPGQNSEVTVDVFFNVHFDGTRYAELVFENGTRFWIDLDTGLPLRERPDDNG